MSAPKHGHTPTSWKLGESEFHIMAGMIFVADCSPRAGGPMLLETGRANARLIVRAVNSHEALLEAAKDWLEYMDAKGMDPEQRDSVRKAIAQAEGKS